MLEDGDILNIDVTLYHNGFHGDINETYYIGEKALADADSIRVVETARDTLDEAIKIVKPGMLFRDPGNVIEKLAKQRNCSVIKTYCGHGINQLFHCPPNVPHYAKNKAVGTAKPGMCFTIEPMIALGTHRDKTWPDDWTSATQDGKRTAQFGKTAGFLGCWISANGLQSTRCLSQRTVWRYSRQGYRILRVDLFRFPQRTELDLAVGGVSDDRCSMERGVEGRCCLAGRCCAIRYLLQSWRRLYASGCRNIVALHKLASGAWLARLG